MRCGNWGKEPFDLRLTLLRTIRCIPGILAVMLAVTLLIGGGYYLKNVTFRGADPYVASATFLVQYEDENWAQNLKYVNEYSWNDWMQSDVFQGFLREHLAENSEAALQGRDLGSMLTAKVPSDLRVVRIYATAEKQEDADTLITAVKAAMTLDFPSVMSDIRAIDLTDTEKATVSIPDVRPVRAFVLAIVIGFFVAILGFLVRELTLEQIWLPTTITDCYGIRNAGMLKNKDFSMNLQYFFQEKTKIAIIPAIKNENAEELVKQVNAQKELEKFSFSALPNPLDSPESLEELKKAEGVLLAVKAGTDAKALAYLLNFLGQQDVEVTAAVLWRADEWLVENYYRLDGRRNAR